MKKTQGVVKPYRKVTKRRTRAHPLNYRKKLGPKCH